MRSGFRYPSLFYYYNPVGIPYGAESVRHYYRCPSFEEALQVLHDDTLVVGVQRIGGFVKEDKLRILIYGTGDEDALFLPLAQPVSFLPYFGVIS